MNTVICKCGYHGDDMVVLIKSPPYKMLVTWEYSNYYNAVKDLNPKYSQTLIWSCPHCGTILAQEREYNSHTFKTEDMLNRLRDTSWNNDKYIRMITSLRKEYHDNFGDKWNKEPTFATFVKIKTGKPLFLKYNMEVK